MKAYFIRRLLLVPITMLGVTLLVFAITRIVPGGPLEKILMEASQASEGGGSGGSGAGELSGAGYEAYEELAEGLFLDKALFRGYFEWLGFLPRERLISKGRFRDLGKDMVEKDLIEDSTKESLVVLKGTGRRAKITRDDKNKIVSAYYSDDKTDISKKGWKVRIENVREQKEKWARLTMQPVENAPDDFADRVVAYKPRFAGLLQGDLGRSALYGDPVWSLIKERIPVALHFGILTVIITYCVCIPLGVVKAIKHRTMIDNATSVLIFVGYSVPGFALGALMVVYLGVRWKLFPMFGLESDNFAEMTTWEQIKDKAWHTVLPLICYVVGSFAFLTMMMKNNLMDNLAADYVRTAVAKGASFRKAVFRHAFRNSFIPIASTLGQLITILVAGSILIESVFDIQGFGLLQLQALLGKDQFVIMGALTISAFLLIVGNILSDVIVSMIDPRVKFN